MNVRDLFGKPEPDTPEKALRRKHDIDWIKADLLNADFELRQHIRRVHRLEWRVLHHGTTEAKHGQPNNRTP